MTILRTKAQEAVVAIFQETLRQVTGDTLVRSFCWREDDRLYIGGSEYDLAAYRRIVLLGAGKASCSMAVGFCEAIGDFPIEGLIVTKYGHGSHDDLAGHGDIELLEAGHPIPDANSLLAGAKMLELAASTTDSDLVVVLISGGASSLMEAPAPGIELADLQFVTEALLRSGAPIEDVNGVRVSLSRIKAGGLARACGGEVVCLLLSDVLGNPREYIGSGPCWGAPPPPSKALDILSRRGIDAPASVHGWLAQTHVEAAVHPEHFVVGDVYTLLEAAQVAAESLGFKPRVYGRTFSGEAREVGARMAAEALSLGQEDGKVDCIVAAGETTVTVRGPGRGGRSQELACAAAIALADTPDIALLAAGTDGTDGPTDAAGGIVDGQTHKRANLRHALDANDSYPVLEAADALLVTGPTQTNLNDIVIVVRVPEDLA
ncbi:MAG TPA: DUF4147 domain-containing protein [Fimbriimonadaceae bacterium]|nr:DUF4147 domain-containing protein [Fimbriimonadaceae bacterium]